MKHSGTAASAYVLDRFLGPSLNLVVRLADGATFLSREYDHELYPEEHPEALEAAAALVNHPNLISVRGPVAGLGLPWDGRRDAIQQHLLWDWCDAGSLEALVQNPPFAKPERDEDPFLPESLIWHVALGVLRALAWLHEGFQSATGDDGSAEQYNLLRNDEVAANWMPVLHRDITPANIYFQTPRGDETYGRCKLANLGQCYVSGSVSSTALIASPTSAYGARYSDDEPLVTTKRGDHPLEKIKEWWLKGMDVKRKFRNLNPYQRPYSTGTDLFALGSVLYQMMTGHRTPDGDECLFCNCFHIGSPPKGCRCYCIKDLDLTKLDSELPQEYGVGIKEVLKDLLESHRDDLARAVECYDYALERYLKWRKTTPDGKLFRDEVDERARWAQIKSKEQLAGLEKDIEMVDVA